MVEDNHEALGLIPMHQEPNHNQTTLNPSCEVVRPWQVATTPSFCIGEDMYKVWSLTQNKISSGILPSPETGAM